MAARTLGDVDSQPFWDGCARGELLLQRCSQCGAYRHPPSSVCPECLSDACTWETASGLGSVYTYSIVRQALGKDWEGRVPYVVAVIELDEGPKILSDVVNVAPEEVTIDMPVVVVFDRIDEANVLPLFEPRAKAGR